MRMHGFCLFALLSACLAVQAQSGPPREGEDNLDHQVKALEQRIQVLKDEIDMLRKKQARLRAEQEARAAKPWEFEPSAYFAKAEIRGILRKAQTLEPTLPQPTRLSWQVVVKGRPLEVRFPEKDKELLAAAEELLNKEVLITGNAGYCRFQQPQVPWNTSPLGPAVPGYRPPPVYLFVVAVESLERAPRTASNADDKRSQQSIEQVQKRIAMLSRKGDDITRRESFELLELTETLKRLSKELEARLQSTKVQIRGKLEAAAPDAWQVQNGFDARLNLNLGNRNDLKTLAKDLEGRCVILTGTITDYSAADPTVNVESLKRAEN